MAAIGDGSYQQIIKTEEHSTNGSVGELLKSVTEWRWREQNIFLPYRHFEEGMVKLGMSGHPLMISVFFSVVSAMPEPL